MKILKIRIKNLNSLLIDTEIDFMKSPFLETGLFAIVGDTGAGKTTILDAITLGLYGKIHRNKDVKEVLSYGATECMAEVEFEVKNERYLGHWDIYRARNKVDGKIQSPTRQIRKWDEETQEFLVITDRVREVDEEVEKITGLDYNRFCRSVLLSQGDFAAFLKSNEKDRSDLLERITGTEIYSEISKATHLRTKMEDGKLHDLKQKREGLSLLDKEHVTELKALLKEKKKEVKTEKSALEELRKTEQWFLNLQKLQQRKVELADKAAILASEKAEHEDDLGRLKLHLKTIPFHTELARFDDKKLEINILNNKISTIEEQIANFKKEEQEIKTILKERQEAFLSLKKGRGDQLKLFDNVLKLDVAIDGKEAPLKAKEKEVNELKTAHISEKEALTHLQQQLTTKKEILQAEKSWLADNEVFKSLPQEYEKIYDWLKDTGSQVRQKNTLDVALKEKHLTLKTAKQKEEKLQQELSQIRLKIKKTEEEFSAKLPDDYAVGRSELLTNLSKEIENLHEKKKNLAEFQKMSNEYSEMLQELGKYHEQLESLQNEEFQVNKLMMDSFDMVDELKKHLEFKQSVHEQQKLILNFENARSNLKEDEPCPLCYSTKHPFRDGDFKPFVDEAKKEFEKAKQQYEKADADLRKLGQQQRDLHLQIKELKGNEVMELGGRMSQKLEKIKAFESQIAGTIAIYEGEEFRTANPAVFTEKIKKFTTEIEEKRQIREVLQQLNSLLEKTQQQEKILSEEWQKQQLLVQQKNGEIDYNQKNINTLERTISDNLARLTKKLKPYSIDFTLEKGNEIFRILKEKKSRIETNSETIQTLNQEVSVLEKESDLKSKTLIENEKRLIKLEQSIATETELLQSLKNERQTLFGTKNVEKERQQLEERIEQKEQLVEEAKKMMNEVVLQLKNNKHQLSESQKELKKATQVSDNILDKISDKLAAAGFEAIEQLRAVILDENEAEKIQAKSEIIKQKESENQQLQKAVEEDLAKESDKGDVNLDAKALRENLEEKEEIVQNLQQEIGGIDQRLMTNDQRKKDAKELIQSIDNQRKELNRWKALNDLIGSADGKKFRTFAQGLTLKKLVGLANRHLQNLSSRYIILKPADKDLDLDILDTYQADNVRSMNTLSGGESFLVSLALALGLSDLAGRNTNIRSLFIDEGFGTLDEGTLDLAISTLENLQSSGKTIGVISHVKELKERITTQIRVRKGGSGFSALEIVG